MPACLVGCALLLGAPEVAQGAPWRSAQVEPGRAAVAHAVDGGPGGAVAIVVERRDGRRRILELREPAGVRTLAVSKRAGFFSVFVDHDEQGRRTVVWSAIPPGGGHLRLYVSEPGAPARRLTGAADAVDAVDEFAGSLDVAPGGQAVATMERRGSLAFQDSLVAYRSAGGTLGRPVDISGSPAVGALAADGTATLISELGKAYVYQRISPDGTLGEPSNLDVSGRNFLGGRPELAVTPGGRAVAVWSRDREVDPDGEVFGDEFFVESRVQASVWEPGAPAPGRPRTLSPSRDFAEALPVVADGEDLTVAWTQDERGSSRAGVRSRSITGRGLGREAVHRLRRTNGFQKYSRAPILLSSEDSRGTLLYPVRGVWYGLELDGRGRPRRERRVTPAGDDVRELFPARTDAGPVALWETDAGVRLGRGG